MIQSDSDSASVSTTTQADGSKVSLHGSVRRSYAGVLLFGMIVLFITGDVSGSDSQKWFNLGAGLCGWGAALLLLPDVRRTQQGLIILLMTIGLVLLWLVWRESGGLAWIDAISRTAGLLTMSVSVGFLKLVALPAIGRDTRLPVGHKAFRDTLMSVAVLGSFINISAPVLIADRLSLNRPLDLFSCSILTRVFSGCSAWSPFFGGMAVVLTYVEDVRLLFLMIAGFPFALAGFITVYMLGVWLQPKAVAKFHGYPMQVSSLSIPAILAVIVVSMYWLAPKLSILTVIALGGLITTVALLLIRRGALDTTSELSEFVVTGLPKTANELVLFLAAGVLAAGLTGIVGLGWITLPITSFDGLSASLLLAAIIVIAMLGIHPVIQVAGLTPLLAVIQPDPLLLAMTYLFGWSLGTCGSPLSGTHLVMQGRYGIPSWKGAINNWPFVAVMYLVAVFLLFTVASLKGL